MLTQPETAAMELPGKRLEAWRYTDLRRLVPLQALAPLPEASAIDMPEDVVPEAFEGLASYRLVFVNGVFQSTLSQTDDLPDGVTLEIADSAESLELLPPPEAVMEPGEVVLHRMNAAGVRDAVWLTVERGYRMDRPLHIVHAGCAREPGSVHGRFGIRLGAGARAVVLETRTGREKTPLFSTQMASIMLEPEARLDHVILTMGGQGMMHVDNRHVMLQSSASYVSTAVALGGRLVRGESHVHFTGSGGRADMAVAALVSEGETGDNVITMNHDAPGCTGAVEARTVVGRKGTGVFQGRVRVCEGAQHTDSRQTTQALLLSPDAVMNARPELDILADDVQCAHGSTIGELDEEAMYYLRSRGIDTDTARRLLVSAFLSDVRDNITDTDIRQGIWMLVEQHLDRVITEISP